MDTIATLNNTNINFITSRLSFVAQRHEWINLRGSSRRKPTSYEGNERQKLSDKDQCQRVTHCNSIELFLHTLLPRVRSEIFSIQQTHQHVPSQHTNR